MYLCFLVNGWHELFATRKLELAPLCAQRAKVPSGAEDDRSKRHRRLNCSAAVYWLAWSQSKCTPLPRASKIRRPPKVFHPSQSNHVQSLLLLLTINVNFLKDLRKFIMIIVKRDRENVLGVETNHWWWVHPALRQRAHSWVSIVAKRLLMGDKNVGCSTRVIYNAAPVAKPVANRATGLAKFTAWAIASFSLGFANFSWKALHNKRLFLHLRFHIQTMIFVGYAAFTSVSLEVRD